MQLWTRMNRFTHWVVYATPQNICFSQRSLWLPYFLKTRTCIEGPFLSLFGENMCGFPATRPSQLWKAEDSIFVGLWEHSWPTTLPLSWETSFKLDLLLALGVGFHSGMQCSVLLFSDSLRGAKFSFGSFLKIHFQSRGQRTLPVYQHEIDTL